MKKKVLVIVAHPDDEALGCAGTIAKHVDQGDTVDLVFMTDGVKSRKESSDTNLKRRIKASKLAQSLLAISSVNYLDFPDQGMDSISILNIIQKLEPIIDRIQPSVIYTHRYGDLNIDHQLTHTAVMTACRPVPDSTVREIYGFEVLSSTEWTAPQQSTFKPTFFVDITKYIQIKLKTLEAYADEMRAPPHSRSIKHAELLAQHRGYSVGINMAEAFEIYRIIK